MSFIETVERASDLLRQRGRISVRVLKRELELDDEALEDLIEELVDVQQVAAREGRALAWIGGAEGSASSAVRRAGATPSDVSASAEAAPEDEAERRQLTVMFVDLVDSTGLSQRLDAEELREVTRAYQESAAAMIERYEGHVAQYLGDGLLVFFGYPHAHEDEAERAVRAGLEIVDAVEALNPRLEGEHATTLALRIGIHTGPVVVGEMSKGDRTDTLAFGDTTNIAARLQGEAAPGTVVMSTATLRLVSGIFVTEDLGARALKGLGESMRVHRVDRPSGMRSRLDVAAATGLTPLVGRDQELGLLEDRFAQMSEGLGQAALISGEAGIGKSRLVQAFRERIAERGHSWLECRCSPYTQDSAFYPVLELQRQALGLGAEVPSEVRVERLEAGLDAAGFELSQAMPLMTSFHGLPLPEHHAELQLSPEGRRKRTLELLVEWLLRLGRIQPLVLLMEDLHWVDPSTQELIGQILERIPRERVLLVATYRPDFEPPWGAKSHLTPMLLARLTRAQLGDLVRKAARDRDLPDAWVEEIVHRSDGVPLFAEELTRTVLESHPGTAAEGDVPALQIPGSLQDSLMARLDALGPVKELAQLASVLGREFDYRLLLAVSPMKESDLQQALTAAVREELFYQRGTPPEASYLFKHALIRDAAYESLLRATRQRHHGRVAETLIERMPVVAEEQPELVAHHLTEAGNAEPAIDWWRRAGERAIGHVTSEEALRYLRRGLSVLETLRPGPSRDRLELDLQMLLGRVLVAARDYAHEDTGRAWQRAESLCSAKDDSLRSGLIAMYVGTFLGTHHPSNGLGHLRRALDIGEKHGDELLILAGCNGCGWILCLMGDLSQSRGYLERAVSLYDPTRHDFTQAGYLEDLGVTAMTWAEQTYWHLGFPDRASRLVERTLEILPSLGKPYSEAWTTGLNSLTALSRGDWTRARSLGARSRTIAVEYGFPFFEGFGRLAEIWALGLSGEDPEVVDQWPAALEKVTSGGHQAGAPLFLGWIAELQLRAGRFPEALQTIEGALALGESTGARFREAELYRLEAEVALARDDPSEEEAEALLRRALDIARSQEAKSLELRAATSLARLWQSQGRSGEARNVLHPVYDWFTEGFDTKDLKDAKALLDELS